MKKSAMQNKLVFRSAAVFFAVLLSVSGLAGDGSGTNNSQSLKDDVTAMITNAKKLPHSIFIIDTSESMNSFAYSDYRDNCADGISNIEKAITLCENAYEQCRNVEANAVSCVDLGCGDVKNKCSKIAAMKEDIQDFCDKVAAVYAEPDKEDTNVNINEDPASLAWKYVGPWNPTKKYKDDICFYDWTKDSDGNVLNGTTTGAPLNPLIKNATDRRDWDCLTDGKGNMYNSDGTTGDLFPADGVSGLWLNWKYATSLDAVKIILANTHQFSFPPRFRGQNDCHKTVYKPQNEYYESAGDESPKKTCFIDFDTAFNFKDKEKNQPYTPVERNAQLAAMEDAIASLWKEELVEPDDTQKPKNESDPDKYAFDSSFCTADEFENPKDIVMYYNDEHPDYDAHPEASDQSGCGRCMKWNPDSKSFVSVPCSAYNGSTVEASASTDFGESISSSFKKVCCKTFECTTPKCRDNDVFCKGDDNDCILGYYSEYDQDANHCCTEVKCVENGTLEKVCNKYNDDGTCAKECDGCTSGSAMGNSSYEGSTGVVSILGKPLGDQSYAAPDDSGIPFDVFLKYVSDTSEIDSVKVVVYYGCLGEEEEHPSKILGSNEFSAGCSGSTGPGCTISGYLKGCDDKGYRAEANISVIRKDCLYDELSVDVQLGYILGSHQIGSYVEHKILDPDKAFYKIFRNETSDKLTKVSEYECRAAFYHRQSTVISSGSCPDAVSAVDIINEENPNSKVEYCDGGSLEREVIDRDMWGNPRKILCSWQCRDSIVYDDPWKCGAFFYMMDDAARNGSEQDCIDNCRFLMGGSVAATDGGSDSLYTYNNTFIEDCCKCLNEINGKYTYLEKPEGVVLSDGESYTCAVSGYQFGTASNGRTTTTSGYMAEIIRGSINEAPGGGSYALQPYNQFENNVHTDSPYDEEWYKYNSLIVKGQSFIKDSFISAFETANDGKRESVCIYDILKYGWTGEDCGNCRTGCCAVDLSQEGNECDYPQFWMKIPKSDGGRHIFGAGQYSEINEFRDRVRSLQAIGGATLGETLYDVWRYLGGMYALYDPNHKEGRTPYESPFEAQDATCFTNEAVIISGGQPEFDHNDAITSYVNVKCPTMKPDSNVTNQPCVAHVSGDTPSKSRPYYQSDWHQTSLLNVANFVHANTFWGKEGECRTDIAKNALGFKDDCAITENNTGNNKAVINRIHTISIGEWGLAPLRSVTNAGTGDFLDSSYLEKTAKNTGGKYYGLTADNPNNQGNGSGGTFSSLTDLFSDMMNKPQATDVVSGRPHWTSSLVQPFDVEEKYRGPEAYSAGAVPIDSSVSRFWFGNLKKYEVDTTGSSCNIVDDTASGQCGEWKKQTFPINDCFGLEDTKLSDFSGKAKSIEQFQKLMIGGAAYKLEQKIVKAGACSGFPCYKSSPRTIFYDDGTENKIHELKGFSVTQEMVEGGTAPEFFKKFKNHKHSLTADELNRILDYMAGYDAFDDDEDGSSTNIRFHDENNNIRTFTVADPIDVNFNSEEGQLTLRPLLLGAIIHSKPVAVYYGSSDDPENTRIYAGANDGMLHAFDGNGEEVYAYIPSNAAKSILNFGNDQKGIFFNATVDGPITMLHIDKSHDGIINSGEDAYLIFGYRRGATGYTVIDISDPDKPLFVQNLNTDGGLSFGKASVFRKCSGVCSYADQLTYYLAVPGGYDECNDPSGELTNLASDNTPSCSSLTGNKFTIYKFDKDQHKFLDGENEPLVFGKGSSDGMFDNGDDENNDDDEISDDDENNDDDEISDDDENSAYKAQDWFATSFTSVPFVVNTKGKAAVDTEFVYFTDLSGTVFRVDVGEADMAKWTAKVVYAQRSLPDLIWSEGITRSYVASNFFPPLERYNPQKNENDETMLIPIPMVSGNSANPKYVYSDLENTGNHISDKMIVFYDKKHGSYKDVHSQDYTANQDGSTSADMNGDLFKSRGWLVDFDPKNLETGEKGITEPLVTYNIYGTQSAENEKANAYTIAWNTYIPKKATDCKNFGTSNNYERLINTGKQAFSDTSMLGTNGEWTASKATQKCELDSPEISIATSVGVIATDKGYDLTFGAGADIFRKREMVVKMNKTYLIKWYELY